MGLTVYFPKKPGPLDSMRHSLPLGVAYSSGAGRSAPPATGHCGLTSQLSPSLPVAITVMRLLGFPGSRGFGYRPLVSLITRRVPVEVTAC